MSYNSSSRERARNAASELAKKIKLEGQLIYKTSSFFKKIKNDARRSFVSDGTKINLINYKNDLVDILSEHYLQVFNNFQSPLINGLKRNKFSRSCFLKKDSQDEDKQKLIDNNQAYIDYHANNQAQQIINTTQNDLASAYSDATATYIVSSGDDESSVLSDDIDRSAIANDASDNFKASTDARLTTIAITETQNAAEAGKDIAVQSSFSGIDTLLLNKEWITILDGRERDSHHEADGQIQVATMPFIVQGEMLMYPGDTFFGASASNIINCRCSVQYFNGAIS